MTWGSDQAEVVKELFSTLNNLHIKYLVMRNYVGLPEKNLSKDIDLAVDMKDLALAKNTLITVMKKQNFSYCKLNSYQYAWCYTFFKFSNENIVSIKIDLLNCYEWYGTKLLSFNDMYEKKIAYKNFFVVDDVQDAVMLWLKPLLTGCFIKQSYQAKIVTIAQKKPSEFTEFLQLLMGSDLAHKTRHFFQTQEDLKKTLKWRKKIAREIWGRAFFKQPLFSIKNLLLHYLTQCRILLFPPHKMIVCALGPDGTGKSTFLDLFGQKLANILIKDNDAIKYIHFRPGILPNIKKLLGGKTNSSESLLPHTEPPANFTSSLVRITYYWLDFIVGYILKIKLYFYYDNIVLLDRYIYDFIVDPYRSKLRLPLWVRKLYVKFTPKARLVFILECEADTIYQRKQELSREEIKRQQAVYQHLQITQSNILSLDANLSPSEMVNQACKILIKHLTKPL